MRKQDLKLGTMYSLNSGRTFDSPVVLTSLSDEFHLARGEVGRGFPTGRALRSGMGHRRTVGGEFPKVYLAIARYPGVANLDEFTTWAEGGPVPAEHAEYLAIARRVGNWLDGLTQHHYAPVPDGLIPSGFRLAQVATRELAGEWLTVQRDRLAAEKAQQAAKAIRDEKRTNEKALYDELVEVAESFGLYVKDDVKAHVDHRFVTDYTRVVLPTEKLLALLTSLRPEG